MDAELRQRITRAIENNDVLLFMKGTRQAPACGFSARTVEMLDSLLDQYATVDVLAHPEVRDGIKEFSSWPTIPQLYVRGEFIGGCDIVTELFETGGLHEKLGLGSPSAKLPSITLTEAAAGALRGALSAPDDAICLEIDRDFQNGLSVGPKKPSMLSVESQGITIAFDRLTASRADGLVIDFIETPEGAAFKLDNPNEPPRVKPVSVQQLSAKELKAKLDAKEDFELVDVRTPGERQTAHIAGSRLLDDALVEELMSLPKSRVLVFQCHHGHRSQRAAEQFIQAGFQNVFNLVGGIEAWSTEVDPSVPRY
jgi:monothiol glutaredoxin